MAGPAEHPAPENYFFGRGFLLPEITKYSNLVYMKDEKTVRNRHHARREALLGQIGGVGPFIEGSLCAVKRAGCAKPGWHLTWKQGGKTRTVYVPVELVPEVKAWTREYKRLKSLIRKVTGQSLALVRGHAASRAAAGRARAPTP
jgi:hypothetical protein